MLIILNAELISTHMLYPISSMQINPDAQTKLFPAQWFLNPFQWKINSTCPIPLCRALYKRKGTFKSLKHLMQANPESLDITTPHTQEQESLILWGKNAKAHAKIFSLMHSTWSGHMQRASVHLPVRNYVLPVSFLEMPNNDHISIG